jgi:putative SOS response-associated peptidase YedK
MCVTFQLAFDENIEESKDIANQLTEKYGNRYSINQNIDFFPKGLAPVIGQNNKVSLLYWGFPMKNSTQVIFNARSDSLEYKPMFSSCLSNRCVVPATAFYEWGTVDNKKVKYLFTVEDLNMFYMAALWKKVKLATEKPSDESSSAEKSKFYFTIITTEPNNQMEKIHNRMPAILNRETAQIWLNNDDLSIIKPYDGGLNYTL